MTLISFTNLIKDIFCNRPWHQDLNKIEKQQPEKGKQNRS
jgi:hypothetical protein